MRAIEYAFKRGATAARFSKTRRQHHRGAHTMFAAGLDDVRHGLSLGAYHRQLDGGFDVFYRGIGALALHFLTRRVHRIEQALIAALQHVPEYDLAYGIGTAAGTDDGNRLGRKELA